MSRVPFELEAETVGSGVGVLVAAVISESVPESGETASVGAIVGSVVVSSGGTGVASVPTSGSGVSVCAVGVGVLSSDGAVVGTSGETVGAGVPVDSVVGLFTFSSVLASEVTAGGSELEVCAVSEEPQEVSSSAAIRQSGRKDFFALFMSESMSFFFFIISCSVRS